MTTVTALDLGRAATAAHQWIEAFDHLTAADREGGLPPQDIEQLAMVALMTGRELDGHGLPGTGFPGDRLAFPTKDEQADYLEKYAVEHALPVRIRDAGGSTLARG